MFKMLIFICAYLSGLFFGVMVLTIAENASKGYRQFVRKVCNKIPFKVRRIIMWIALISFAVFGYKFFGVETTRGAIFCGMAAGVFIYFKAGVTMGNNPDPYNKERKAKQKQLKNKKK
ncbi:MAG: hypothetical protein PUE18_03850 [Firmicutes bacterium]|nr:hypothetical protein [Bacillota bacterium]